jgi:hypothetical protein
MFDEVKYNKGYRNKLKTNTPWKLIYWDIKKRCISKGSSNHKYYIDKGIECLISEEEVKYLWFRDKAYLMEQPSIDRKNSNGNYTFDNCQFLEFDENRRKAVIKPVIQYDLQGNFVREWDCIIDVERETNISHKQICSNLKNKQKSVHGFIFKYKNTQPLCENILAYQRNFTWKPIVQCTLDGKQIKEFRSSVDAENELRISHKAISQCLRGKSKSSGGFIWKYKEIK